MCALHYPRGVLCAKVRNKVNFKEDPSTAWLSTRDVTVSRHTLQRNGMYMQECSGGFNTERFIIHESPLQTKVFQLYTEKAVL
jgi:hypothetical protein